MKAIVTPPKRTITQERLIYLVRAVWYLNDIQLNYWNELKMFLDRSKALRHDNKSLIKRILDNLRRNTFAQIWRNLEKDPEGEDAFAESAECQDRMEEVMEQSFDSILGLQNRFVCFYSTDFGKGDLCWIHSDDEGAIQVKVLGCRLLWESDISDGEKSETVIRVIAINRDGKEYGEPFWVRDEHIARHRKEFNN